MGWAGHLCVLSISAGLLASPGLAWWPLAFVFPTIFLIGTLIISRRDDRIARIRSGETICNFARSFDCRVIDTWIIRAVFEEFSDRYPIRSSDTFENDLGIDDEDIDEYVMAIAERVGRSLDDPESNPVYGKVETVYDLVTFLQYQPEFEPPRDCRRLQLLSKWSHHEQADEQVFT